MKLKTEKKLLPGAPGTQKLVDRYGDDLRCVRYLYDADRDVTVKTVELIVETRPRRRHAHHIPKNKLMPLRVKYGEVSIGKQIRAAGGTWHPQEQVWKLAYEQVVALGLTGRIVHEHDMAPHEGSAEQSS